jgi:hypothetical protein
LIAVYARTISEKEKHNSTRLPIISRNFANAVVRSFDAAAILFLKNQK